MARLIFAIVLFAATLGIALPVCACPFCESTTAEQVRAGIFNSDFVYHLGASFAPFPVLIAILILIYYWPSRRPLHLKSDTLQQRDPHISESELV